MIENQNPPAGYQLDGKGNLVADANIKEIDKLRDQLVRKLFLDGHALSERLYEFKMRAMSEIDAFVSMSAAEYGAKVGGAKGNMTLYSFDQRLKVQISIGDRLTFDERLAAAKSLIDDCIKEWGAGANKNIMALINQAFQVDKTGKINVQNVLALRRLDISDPKWLSAMAAISDAVQVVSSTRYVRFYERLGETDQYRLLNLDLAKL